ncbi:tail protein X [Psychrobacillus sp. FSL K6-1464]|uniref:tail protein X n=1 Tax=Psychrobacillus sp. FSL K6-1464 TaxID=2921545 RepID=UPI0030FC7397
MKQYITIQGDMWDIISKNSYGSELHTEALIKANPQHASVMIFPSEIVLNIPDVEVIEQFTDLPPWKRG